MDTRDEKRKHEENIENTSQTRQKVPTEKNLSNLGTGKVDNFVAEQKFWAIEEFKLNVFDIILDISHLEYTKAVKKESENGELDCTDGVSNTRWRIWWKAWRESCRTTFRFKEN